MVRWPGCEKVHRQIPLDHPPLGLMVVKTCGHAKWTELLRGRAELARKRFPTVEIRHLARTRNEPDGRLTEHPLTDITPREK